MVNGLDRSVTSHSRRDSLFRILNIAAMPVTSLSLIVSFAYAIVRFFVDLSKIEQKAGLTNFAISTIVSVVNFVLVSLVFGLSVLFKAKKAKERLMMALTTSLIVSCVALLITSFVLNYALKFSDHNAKLFIVTLAAAFAIAFLLLVLLNTYINESISKKAKLESSSVSKVDSSELDGSTHTKTDYGADVDVPGSSFERTDHNGKSRLEYSINDYDADIESILQNEREFRKKLLSIQSIVPSLLKEQDILKKRPQDRVSRSKFAVNVAATAESSPTEKPIKEPSASFKGLNINGAATAEGSSIEKPIKGLNLSLSLAFNSILNKRKDAVDHGKKKKDRASEGSFNNFIKQNQFNASHGGAAISDNDQEQESNDAANQQNEVVEVNEANVDYINKGSPAEKYTPGKKLPATFEAVVIGKLDKFLAGETLFNSFTEQNQFNAAINNDGQVQKPNDVAIPQNGVVKENKIPTIDSRNSMQKSTSIELSSADARHKKKAKTPQKDAFAERRNCNARRKNRKQMAKNYVFGILGLSDITPENKDKYFKNISPDDILNEILESGHAIESSVPKVANFEDLNVLIKALECVALGSDNKSHFHRSNKQLLSFNDIMCSFTKSIGAIVKPAMDSISSLSDTEVQYRKCEAPLVKDKDEYNLIEKRYLDFAGLVLTITKNTIGLEKVGNGFVIKGKFCNNLQYVNEDNFLSTSVGNFVALAKDFTEKRCESNEFYISAFKTMKETAEVILYDLSIIRSAIKLNKQSLNAFKKVSGQIDRNVKISFRDYHQKKDPNQINRTLSSITSSGVVAGNGSENGVTRK